MGAKPIIVIKKKGGHGGHHGGAWKVAYADFVTAMMALFIVLWLLNSSKKIQDAVGGYFRDPHGTADKAGKDIVGSAGGSIVPHDNMQELKKQLEKAISGVPNFDKLKNHIEMTVTPEGLRIELLEAGNSTFFESGSSKPSRDGQAHPPASQTPQRNNKFPVQRRQRGTDGEVAREIISIVGPRKTTRRVYLPLIIG
jgi:chemotaxis protein MotB